MRLLPDTATFIWALESPERLSRKAMAALERNEAVRELSAGSLSEIAIKSAIGKLSRTERNVLTGIADLQMRVLPYTAEHAYRLFGPTLHHPDPFDRQIVARRWPKTFRLSLPTRSSGSKKA